jgi:outer membrane protein
MKGITKVLSGILIVFGMGSALCAQKKLVLSLDDSIRLALGQNPYHLASAKRVDAARAQVHEARAGFLPTLNAQGTSTLAEKVFELEFPSMDPSLPPQRVEIDFSRDYQMSMGLNIPLFTSGRLKASYRMANYNLRSTEEAKRQSGHVTIFNTKSAFYGILLMREYVNVAEMAIADADKLYDLVKKQHEVGLASQFDLLRSEVRVANMRPQVISAKNNLKIMELNLKTILGLDLDTEIELDGNLSFDPVTLSLPALMEKAMLHRPELAQVRFQKGVISESYKIARSGALPSLAISGQFNWWADKLKLGGDVWQDYYTVNLVLNVPLFNGLANLARMGQAKAAIKEIEFNEKGLVDQLNFEVRQAVLKVEEARESLASQEKNVEQAKESLRIADLNFAEGLITILDIGQAQTALTQARVNYSQALFDYVMALAEVDRVTGVDTAPDMGESQ